MHIFLDESGDLGFDFKTKKPSKFFVITLLQVKESHSIKSINKAVFKTINKVNKKRKKTLIEELKGNDTRLEIKKYFLNCLNQYVDDFEIYSIVLDKQDLLQRMPGFKKNILYHQMTHQLLEKIQFTKKSSVNLVIDRCKNNLGIKEFNSYLYSNLTLCLNLETTLYINHENSINHKCIQAVDMFCYGIARKYELNDDAWYNEYKDKIVVECKFTL